MIRFILTIILVQIPARGVLSQEISALDDLDRQVVLSSPAQRIVSLAPSITETLFALGAGSQVVGVTDYCNYPEEAAQRPSVGGMTNPSIESIMALRPDLVVTSMEGNIRESFDALDRLHVTLFVSNPRSFTGIYKSIADLATLSGHNDEGNLLISSMKQRESAVRAEPAPHTSLFIVVSLHPLMVVGEGTFLSELISEAGGENLAEGTGMTYPTFSREAFLARQPETLFITSETPLELSDLLTEFPEWKDLPAFRDGRIFTLDPDMVSRPGPRIIDALEEVAGLLR